MDLTFSLNGKSVSVEADGSTPLLFVLRNNLGLAGTRFGCGVEQCGACTILVDQQPVLACTLALECVSGRDVRTIEGLCGDGGLHPVQQALIDEQAGQCGYCLSGITVRLVHLLQINPHPPRAAILEALDKHLCRCGAQFRILRAVEHAVAILSGAE